MRYQEPTSYLSYTALLLERGNGEITPAKLNYVRCRYASWELVVASRLEFALQRCILARHCVRPTRMMVI